MGDQPTTTNPTATAADKIIHTLIFDVAVKAAEAEIVSVFPVMGLPIIKQLDELLLEYLAQKIYEKLALGVTFAIIDIQVSQEVSDAKAAQIGLQTAISQGDEHAISLAKEAFSKAFGRLIHYDGSASP